MMYRHIFIKTAQLLFVCFACMLAACKDSPEVSVSATKIVFDAVPTEEQTIDVSANVDWTATVKQTGDWLTVFPASGSGDASITLKANDNPLFVQRTASIAISGDGVQADSVMVIQMPGINVADSIDDDNFRQYCLDRFDIAPRDGRISLKEARDVKEIIVNQKEIESLAGIEYFTNVVKLDCGGNKLESIDISKNTALVTFECSYNLLPSLDVTQNIKLLTLLCYGNELTSLDVSKNTALTWLGCSGNKITALNVSGNIALEVLECGDNPIASLDVSKNTKLITLSCSGNRLSSLDVSRNTSLLHLWCGTNQLISLDISQNLSLQTLLCHVNKLTSLDVRNNTRLTQLSCNSNQLTTIDLSRNTELNQFTCSSNRLAGTLDIRNNSKLKSFDLVENPQLRIIIVWSSFDANNSNYMKDGTATYVFN